MVASDRMTVVRIIGQQDWQNCIANISGSPMEVESDIIAYAETASLIFDRTIASSLIKCGLFPVFSNCSITPTTISSLIPSVSTLRSVYAPGEGGGVFS